MSEMKGIKTWSEDDRPREKLLLKGSKALSDAELLAIIIGSGHKEANAVEVSRLILKSIDNNLVKLGQLTIQQLTDHKGIGEAKAISIVAVMELARRRAMIQAPSMVNIDNSKAAYDLIGPDIEDLHHEEFWVLLLTTRSQFIKKVKLGQGGMDKVAFDKSIAFKHAIEHSAKCMILVHNHPSGISSPSSTDVKLTHDFVAAGKLLDIKILDHLIIGRSSYYSFNDEGLIS